MNRAFSKVLLATIFFGVSTLTQTALAQTQSTQSVNAAQPVQYHLSQAEKNPWEAMGLNLIPFGVGSFRQGDQVGGITIAVIDGVVALAMLSFAVKAAQARPGYASAIEIATIFFGLCLGRIIGFIAPWVHWSATSTQASAEAQTQDRIPENTSLWSYQLDF
jgi:hypothetical protein